MEKRILFKDKLKKSSIEFMQFDKGGCIWVESTGSYPITPEELKQVLKSYKEA